MKAILRMVSIAACVGILGSGFASSPVQAANQNVTFGLPLLGTVFSFAYTNDYVK